MRKFSFILILGFISFSCAEDNESCQTCTASTNGGDVKVEYCQEGNDVISNTDGVLATIPNTTVEVIIAGQEALPEVSCN